MRLPAHNVGAFEAHRTALRGYRKKGTIGRSPSTEYRRCLIDFSGRMSGASLNRVNLDRVRVRDPTEWKYPV